MRRRKLIVGLVLLGLIAGGITFFWLNSPPPRINPGQYQQIHEGMVLEEVEAVIGGPPGFYPPNLSGTRVRLLDGHEFGGDARLKQEYWSGSDYEIGVLVNDEGTVVAKQLTKVRSYSRHSWLDDLCNMLRR
jgi:hypothetical protein